LFLGERTTQGTCPATVPAFANGVNGAKVVGKGTHGAHDENMSGSIVPVDCTDGFTATPEGSNPLVFQRCEPVAHSHIDGACTTGFNPTDDKNTANCPAAHPQCVEWATAPSQKRCQRGRSTGYAWVNHGTCDAPPIRSELQTRYHKNPWPKPNVRYGIGNQKCCGQHHPCDVCFSVFVLRLTCGADTCTEYDDARKMFDGDSTADTSSDWWCTKGIFKNGIGLASIVFSLD
jgi:hypothetical protein